MRMRQSDRTDGQPGTFSAVSSLKSNADTAAAADPGRAARLSTTLQRAAGNPSALTRADIAGLQRTIGNAQAGRLLKAAVPRANNTGLPDPLKARVEGLSGLAMDDVRVHYNSTRPTQVEALATTQGNDIHIAPGQERHLPHEAWHVVQQKQGRVAPTLQMKGVAINDDSGLEREADRMGDLAHRTAPVAASMLAPVASARSASGVTQRFVALNARVAYTPKNNRAGAVEVENLDGTPYGAGANAPSVDVFGWQQLMAAGHTHANVNSTHYNAVRMHLWNGRLGGPGNDWRNLAPGPQQINSSMSAGPETASKDAVSAGDTIWLKTEVWYHSNSGLQTDFQSVIPNRMKMEWGYMLGTGGRGAAQPPAWDVPIDQPAGALSASQQAAYTTLGDLQTADLDTLLAHAAVQTQAQAYSLVTPALKKHMLLHYPDVYQNMGDAERTTALGGLSVAEIDALKTLIGVANVPGFYNEIMYFLLADQPKLQDVFKALPGGEKTTIALYGGWELLYALDTEAEPLAKADWRIFSLYPAYRQYDLLDDMSPDAISTLTGGRIKFKLFEAWGEDRVEDPNAFDISNYVAKRLTDGMAIAFDNALEWRRRAEAPRSRKTPKRNTLKDQRGTPY